MRIAVDMENLRITHIHPDVDIIHGLVYLEGAGTKYVLFENTDRAGFLSKLTTLEINLLYRNTTGQDFPAGVDDLTRRQVLAELVDASEPRKVVPDELEVQIQAVSDKLEAPLKDATLFRYVLGARIPAINDGGLFPIKAAPVSAAQLEMAAQVAPQRRELPASPCKAPSPAARPTLARSAPRANGGSVRPVVWAVADRMWEAAGKPAEKGVVLELRKKIMTVLEEENGVKKTTSSTSLGEWMKARLG